MAISGDHFASSAGGHIKQGENQAAKQPAAKQLIHATEAAEQLNQTQHVRHKQKENMTARQPAAEQLIHATRAAEQNHKQAESLAARRPAAEQLIHATEAAEQLDETNT